MTSGTSARELERSRRAFLLARAQLAAGRADEARVDVARRRWPSHRRRFSGVTAPVRLSKVSGPSRESLSVGADA